MALTQRLQLPNGTSKLLKLGEPTYITVAGVELAGVSHSEVEASRFAKYAGAFERFVRAVILGFRGTVAIDYFNGDDKLKVRILVGQLQANSNQVAWSPHAQLERLRLQVARGIRLEPFNPPFHLDELSRLQYAVTIEPATEEVSHSGLRASAVLPIELSPSGIGTLAQVLEGLQSRCCVRILIAPMLLPRPEVAILMDQLANADRLCNDPEAPRAVAYRSRAVRLALKRMMNCWLGQACVVQLQVRSTSAGAAEGVVQLLRDEIARPKADELTTIRGRSSSILLMESGDEIPTLAVSPTVTTITAEQLISAPVPSFWISGVGERPKHLTGIESAALLTLPPLPEYCDLASIESVVVEAKGASQPAKWQGADRSVGNDPLENQISFDNAALERHVHLIGVPGSGKTTLMYRMALADLQATRGFLILDPHGDLARRVAEIAGWGEGGIVGNAAFPGLKLLCSIADGETAVERDVGAILEAIESALPKEFTGPRFRQLARACLTLHAYAGQGAPVAEAVTYLHDEISLTRALANYNGPRWLRDHFTNFALQQSHEKAEIVDWFESKFTDYLRTSGAQQLFSRVGEGLTAQEIVSSKAQFTIDFAALGASTYDSGLLGQLFVTSFLRNLMAGGPNLQRRFLLYLDEVQLFFGPSVERALQEGRKYGLSVVAAHQTSSQLSQQRFDSLVGQVGLELVFRCSLRDSQLLSEHLDLTLESVAALPDFSCWVAGGIAVQRGGSFLLTTSR